MPESRSQNVAPKRYFEFIAGVFLFIALIKFGNPIILDFKVEAPQNLVEFMIQSWPAGWGYALIIPVVLAAVLSAFTTNVSQPIQKTSAPNQKSFLSRVLPWLPLAWLLWQSLSALKTVDEPLTSVTLKYFVSCVALFYAAYFGLRGKDRPVVIWIFLALSICWILRTGLDQHFGGLEATRRYFRELHPDWQTFDPAFLKKLESNRITGTFCYPNAFAAGILMVFPLLLVLVWQLTAKFSKLIRGLLVAVFGGTALACLFWSGSKSGLLLVAVVGFIALWNSRLRPLWKIVLTCGVVLFGVGGFFVKFAEKGSSSASARMDYWRTAVQSTKTHPVLGSGPGTFYFQYRMLKPPEAEMTRLCHNDYLQQASDSGFPGFLFYSALITIPIGLFYRRQLCSKTGAPDWMNFAIWIGVLGLCLHSIAEFHLYVPSLGWVLFFVLGWMARRVQAGS